MAGLGMVTVYDKAGQNKLIQEENDNFLSYTIGDLISYVNTQESLSITDLATSKGGTELNHSNSLSSYGSDPTFYDVTPEPAPSYPETIAGQISRLQDAKACIKAAIEEKGVTVGSDVTLDGYACCIGEISSGGSDNLIPVELLAIGGGGSGAGGMYGGGGGAGGVVYNTNFKVGDMVLVSIGCGGTNGSNGGNTEVGDCIAYGGGAGNFYYGICDGGSGGGGGCMSYCNGKSVLTQGNYGGFGCSNAGGGGGGAGGRGCNTSGNAYCCGGQGGSGICTDITGTLSIYAGGGGGAGRCYGGSGINGGGAGGSGSSGCGCNATTYGSGGGGGSCGIGSGCQGIVVVRYKTECGYELYGGCKYTCGDYTIHCFTIDGALYQKPTKPTVLYTVVGGGGGGGTYSGKGGGGGDVLRGVVNVDVGNSYSVIVGCGGSNSGNGTASEFNGICAKGGCGSNYNGTSGSGCAGGANLDSGGGGGGGASSDGKVGYNCYYGGVGGSGKYGYGGGGGGGGRNGKGGGRDGGGDGGCCTNGCDATNYGGGGGGAGYNRCCKSNGCQGVVDICYPCDGSFGFCTATGGNSCYLCGDICVHRFTSNGTFTVTG